MLEICVYRRHCNICNIPIYFCNIHSKHLQHTSETSETIETYACNMRFHATSPCCLPHGGSAPTRAPKLRQATMPLPSKIIHEQASHLRGRRERHLREEGAQARQGSRHSTTHNKQEFVYYAPSTEGCAMWWRRKRPERRDGVGGREVTTLGRGRDADRRAPGHRRRRDGARSRR